MITIITIITIINVDWEGKTQASTIYKIINACMIYMYLIPYLLIFIIHSDFI